MSEPAVESLQETWAEGDAYDYYMGRWSRRVAAEFVDWMHAAPYLAWADIGCGTAPLTQEILARAEPRVVTAVDRYDGYLENARARIEDLRAIFEKGEAESLPLEDDSVHFAVSGLILNVVDDLPKALAEMKRVTKPGGVVAAYVWDHAGHMQYLRTFWNAARSLDPEAEAWDKGLRSPHCRPEPLRQAFQDAGLDEVIVRNIDIITSFSSFDDYWAPFLGGQGTAPSYCVGLQEEQREALRQKLEESLPRDPDGEIALVARAWAVWSKVPE